MRKTMPVGECMSRLPEEVDRREALSAVIHKMREHHIRHVPVLDGPRIFGLLSLDDVLEVWRREGASAGTFAVGDVCTRAPLTVSPLEPIPAVARQMVGRGVTGALVADNGVMVGIFTSVDALRILADL